MVKASRVVESGKNVINLFYTNQRMLANLSTFASISGLGKVCVFKFDLNRMFNPDEQKRTDCQGCH
jgi:hypothetical protein